MARNSTPAEFIGLRLAYILARRLILLYYTYIKCQYIWEKASGTGFLFRPHWNSTEIIVMFWKYDLHVGVDLQNRPSMAKLF